MTSYDFRSDTVTQPTAEMREAMAKAPVGDDVYGEDPSINRLQQMAAKMLGMQAGLFVPSGTMGNLAAVLSHCQRGDEAILGNKSHIFSYEAGGISALASVNPHILPNQANGELKLEDIKGAIRHDDPHCPITRLISIENTHNRCGGVSLSAEYTQSVADLAKEYDLKLHIDGARIFNAAVDQGVDASELTSPADSVTFCLSKGLAGPVGSVLCGSEEFIHRANRARKQLGGGMRQAGIVAAAGIVALESMVDRMSDDHARAKRLAEKLEAIEGLVLDARATNMVYVSLDQDVQLTGEEFVSKMKSLGVLIGQPDTRQFRLVTHCWIDDAALERAADAAKKILNAS